MKRSKQDELEYQRIHREVRKYFGGKASGFQCLWCFDLAEEYAWMWRTGRPSTDLAAYVPLCRRDHREYDYERALARNRGNRFAAGHTLSEEAKARCSRAGSKHSEETRARMRASQQLRRTREREA